LGNLVVLVAGSFAVLNRESLDAGTVGLSISCAIQVTRTLNNFIRKAADTETSSVSIERVKEFSETQQVRTPKLSYTNYIIRFFCKAKTTFDLNYY